MWEQKNEIQAETYVLKGNALSYRQSIFSLPSEKPVTYSLDEVFLATKEFGKDFLSVLEYHQ